MAKKFPRFLISDPTNVKEKGPFIIHTLEPQFICKPEFDDKRNVVDFRILEVFGSSPSHSEADEIAKEIPLWYRHSGIHQSSNTADKIFSEISKCEFVKNYQEHYTVEEASTIVSILFPTKAKAIYEGSSSYGLKHLLEHLSRTILNTKYGVKKYCSNDTIIKAFELQGFRMKEYGPNMCMTNWAG